MDLSAVVNSKSFLLRVRYCYDHEWKGAIHFLEVESTLHVLVQSEW